MLYLAKCEIPQLRSEIVSRADSEIAPFGAVKLFAAAHSGKIPQPEWAAEKKHYRAQGGNFTACNFTLRSKISLCAGGAEFHFLIREVKNCYPFLPDCFGMYEWN